MISLRDLIDKKEVLAKDNYSYRHFSFMFPYRISDIFMAQGKAQPFNLGSLKMLKKQIRLQKFYFKKL
jgi:hypothetical protein